MKIREELSSLLEILGWLFQVFGALVLQIVIAIGIVELCHFLFG